MAPVTCVVTIHGIGFQQPPDDEQGVLGYADAFHRRLSTVLQGALGDDPNRIRDHNVHGPVYVHSNWPRGTGGVELGLARLGKWQDQRPASVSTDQPLVDGDQTLAHVALVYAHLEPKTAAIGPLAEISTMAAVSLGHYTSVTGLLHMAWTDLAALLPHAGGNAQPTPSLQARTDELSAVSDHPVAGIFQSIIGQPETPTGLLATLRQLENDVAAYVTRNELRQRVRSFIQESLLRLAYRPDVAGIVVNSHSQGTAIAFDVLRDFPPVALSKIKAFITAGSPLRKYVDLFQWGDEVGCIYGVGPWTNFWDVKDPVADSLNATADWKPGQPADRARDVDGLFRAADPDTGNYLPFWIDEVVVDNLTNSQGGGLQAHNYWDNEPEFVAPVAQLLRGLVV
jgi:hypothetical protein